LRFDERQAVVSSCFTSGVFRAPIARAGHFSRRCLRGAELFSGGAVCAGAVRYFLALSARYSRVFRRFRALSARLLSRGIAKHGLVLGISSQEYMEIIGM